MNRFLVVLFLMSGFIVLSAKAQDLIVTSSGDSLNCTVMVQNLRSVNFFYKDGNKVVTRELQRNSLKTVIIGFYNPAKKGSQPSVVEKTQVESVKASSNDARKILETESSLIGNSPVLDNQTAASSQEPTASESSVLDSLMADSTKKTGESSQIALATGSSNFSGNSRWYFGFKGGYANRLFRTGNRFSPAYSKYLKELKSGYAVGVGFGYFFWKNVALALNADLYKSSATMEDDSRDDAITLRYIGPSLIYRKVSLNQKSAVYTGVTVGYQTYSNQAHQAGNLLVTTGKAAGWGVNVGMDYKISPRAAISFTASCIMGTIYEMSKEAGGKKETIRLSKNDFEELSRISLTVGLRFF